MNTGTTVMPRRPLSFRPHGSGTWARSIGLAVLLALGVALSVGADGESRYPIGARPDLSRMGFVDETGKTVSVADLKGKVVLIEFWTTWCPSCRESLTLLLAIEKAAASRGDVAVIPCNLDDDFGSLKLRRFMSANSKVLEGFRYFRPGSGKRGIGANLAEKLTGYPTTLLLDRDGRLAARWAGFGREYLVAELDRVLTEPSR